MHEETANHWLDVKGAAKHAGVSADTIYKACHRKELRYTRIGGRRVLKFQPTWIDEWMSRGVVPPIAHETV